MEIFVANFKDEIEEVDLERLFGKYGEVTDVEIICNWRTGESAGYAFVEMPDDDDAEFAIEQLNGHWWNGRRLKVNKKRERRSNWDDWDEEDEELFRKND
jgi:RNA recognition motif-containing protein